MSFIVVERVEFHRNYIRRDEYEEALIILNQKHAALDVLWLAISRLPNETNSKLMELIKEANCEMAQGTSQSQTASESIPDDLLV